MNDFTPEKWNAMSMAGLYTDTEWVTAPSASALITQAGLSGGGTAVTGVKVLDIGCGIGQLCGELYDKKQGWAGEVTLGDIEPSMLQACKDKVVAKGWEGAEVGELDIMKLAIPDGTFSHVLANFVYFLLPKPVEALKESIRVLQPGGTLGFTTWDICGPRNLLQHAQALIPEAPNTRTIEINAMQLANGYWHDRQFIRQTLESLGLTDIKIEGFNHRKEAASARECAYAMRSVTRFSTQKWPDQDAAWRMFEKFEEVLKGEYGDGKVGIWSVALIVTAKKPE